MSPEVQNSGINDPTKKDFFLKNKCHRFNSGELDRYQCYTKRLYLFVFDVEFLTRWILSGRLINEQLNRSIIAQGDVAIVNATRL